MTDGEEAKEDGKGDGEITGDTKGDRDDPDAEMDATNGKDAYGAMEKRGKRCLPLWRERRGNHDDAAATTAD